MPSSIRFRTRALLAGAVPALLLLALLAPHAPPAEAAPAPVWHVVEADDPVCQPSPRMAVEGRASPYDSASVALGDGMVKVCYGAPALRGRVMIGGEAVPFGQMWRFGANEPTTLHTSIPLSVGGVAVPAGSVALYALPGEGHWEIFVTRSTEHWGLQITPEVRAQEIGSMHVVPASLEEEVESMVFRFEDAGSRSATLVMEWQNTRLEIPVTATGG
jgi:hypothetical protein